MLLSMTGYGRAESRDGGRNLYVEIRSINHRFAEVSVRLPKTLASLETRVRDRVAERLTRGKVTLAVSLDGEEGDLGKLKVDVEVAKRYAAILRDLKDKLQLTGDLDIGTFVGLPDILTWEKSDLAEEEGWRILGPPLDRALDDLLAMKRREGEILSLDMTKRVEGIVEGVTRVEERVPLMIDAVRQRLQERMEEIFKDQDIEYQRQRLEAELILFADRSDCTEECVRLRAHCQQFLELVRSPNPAGRKLTFLLQEMNREANTIGSKSLDVPIAREVIGIKEEAERLREQVANIE
jgi:uncharacterized protein (TIGR00255 family)